jgi:hypothetical protein
MASLFSYIETNIVLCWVVTYIFITRSSHEDNGQPLLLQFFTTFCCIQSIPNKSKTELQNEVKTICFFSNPLLPWSSFEAWTLPFVRLGFSFF